MEHRRLLLTSEASEPDTGVIQGSHGLLQNLLDLGEAFLASEIGEEDLRDLETKLSAARNRDYGTIRDLQRKIEELSGMSAMVSRLKEELREEKAKAQEEAEDLTQEMAELRYQLMERLDEEREIRARTEEASLRRISELESQLKHAWREISSLQGAKQSADVQAQSRLVELQHLKCLLEESKCLQENLTLEKREAENQYDQLQLKVMALERDLSEARSQMFVAEQKAHELEKQCLDLKETYQRIPLEETQGKDGEESKTVDEGFSAFTQSFETSLGSIEEQNEFLKHEVKAMLDLVADFKHQLQSLATEYHKANDKLPITEWTYIDYNNDNNECMEAVGVKSTCLSENEHTVKVLIPLTLQEVVETVGMVGEEMIKLLQAMLKNSESSKGNVLCSLKSRLQLWSDMPQKALAQKLLKSGIPQELDASIVDLVAQFRRGMLGNIQTEMEMKKNARADLVASSQETVCAKEESEACFSSHLSMNEDDILSLESKLEQSSKTLLQYQEKVKELEESNSLLHGLNKKLQIDSERSNSVWALEKKRFEENIQYQHDLLQKERSKANKEIDKLEKIVEDLRQRLAENEQELEELVQANDLNIDAVVTAKFRQLEQKLKNSQLVEEEIQAERVELASQVVWLQAKLEEAERELETQNEQHVEVLIQYEEERGFLEAEVEAGKDSFVSPDSKTEIMDEPILCHQAEHKQLEQTVEMLKARILGNEELLRSQNESRNLQIEINRSLVKHSAILDSELLAVRERLLASETQVLEMESVIASLQEELLLERMETAQMQEDVGSEVERLARKEQDYIQLKTSFDEIVLNMRRTREDLIESQEREERAHSQVRNISFELSLVKEEVVKSEVRLAKALKEKDKQIEAVRAQLDAVLAGQKQTEWLLSKRTAELKIAESEKMELQRLMKQAKGTRDQMERERDDLKIAYAELENQFSRRRVALGV